MSSNRSFGISHALITQRYFNGNCQIMKSVATVKTIPERLANKIEELQKQIQKINQDTKISEKDKQEMIARYNKKIQEINQSLAHLAAYHAM